MSLHFRLVPRHESRVQRQAKRNRPQIESMERRILLSSDLVGSTRKRLHAASPVQSIARSAGIVILDAAKPARLARAKSGRTETAFAVPSTPDQVVNVTFR